MDQPVGILIVGLAAGVLSGMFGIGGGVVIVPILVTLFGFGLKEAVGTSLAALLMPVGIFAAIAYYRAGKLKIGIALWVALGLAVGATVSAQIAIGLDKDLIQKAYALFLLFVGWRFAEPRKWWREYRASTPPPVAEREPRTTAWYVLLGIGFAAGILSGLFGVGGGIVIVPVLVGLLWFDQKLASGTSLGALLLPVGLGAAASYYDAGLLDIGVAALVAGGLTVGALVGARIALGLPSKTVKRMYGVFLLLVAFRFLFF